MTEPLVVDTMRLDSAGAALRAVTFPRVPPAITATGGDAVSAAINATMPVVESPMIEGLPAAQAALAKTAASIAAAASMYADTDQALARSLPQHVELVARGEGGARTYSRASAAPAAAVPGSSPPDAAPDPLRPGGQLPGPFGSRSPQFAQTVESAGSFVQSVQAGVQGLAGDAKGPAVDTDPRDETEADDGGAAAVAASTVGAAAVPETVMAPATTREMTTKESS